jgi:hypothetical protein
MPPRRQTRRAPLNQPTAADRHRFDLFRAGVSVAEIATRDRVPVTHVEKSILRCREERQRYSQEAVEVAVRQTVLAKLPEASKAISGALQATRKETVSVVIEGEQMEETVDVPDHHTRLKGNTALIELLTAIKVNAPMVNVDARQQTQNVLGLPAHTGQPSSAEAIIREIRAARGLALTDGATAETGNVAAVAEVDTELAEEMEDEDDDEDEESEDEDGE